MRRLSLSAILVATLSLLFAQATRPPAGPGKGGGSTSFVASFLGRVGAVVPQSNDYSFSQLSGLMDPAKIAQSGATTGQALVWNGSHYAPGDVASEGEGGPVTIYGSAFPGNIPIFLDSDGTQLVDSGVSGSPASLMTQPLYQAGTPLNCTGQEGNTNSAMSCLLNPALSGYVLHMLLRFTPALVNSGAFTLNINFAGATSVKSADCTTDPPAGYFQPGQTYLLTYNGTVFCEIHAGGAAPLSVGTTAGTVAAGDDPRFGAGGGSSCQTRSFPAQSTAGGYGAYYVDGVRVASSATGGPKYVAWDQTGGSGGYIVLLDNVPWGWTPGTVKLAINFAGNNVATTVTFHAEMSWDQGSTWTSAVNFTPITTAGDYAQLYASRDITAAAANYASVGQGGSVSTRITITSSQLQYIYGLSQSWCP